MTGEAQGATVRNMLTTATLIAASALARTESRGGHYRSDYPEPNPLFARRSRLNLSEARFLASQTRAA